jgi:hypothetical protein
MLYAQNCHQILSDELKSTEIYNLLFYKEFDFGDKGVGNAFNYIGNNYNKNDSDLYNQLTNLEPVAYVIESFIIMYETTKDKAYLIKAVNKSIELINNRGTNQELGPYTWASNQTSTFSLGPNSSYVPNPPGLVLWAMAHLCHLILYDYPELCNTPLPNNLLVPNTSNYPYTNGIDTYGLFADWLVRRCVESLDWYLHTYWIGPSEGFRDEYNDDYGAAINQQAPFAAAFFYLGHLTNIAPCFAYQGFYSGLASYIDRAAEMAEIFSGSFKLYKDCPTIFDCIYNNPCPVNLSLFDQCFELPRFRFESISNSYWWYTNGGMPKEIPFNLLVLNSIQPFNTCNEPRTKCSYYFDETSDAITNNEGRRIYEDISHGIRTLIYPEICTKYNFISGGIPYFDAIDMIRFRNTFVNVVWNQDIQNPQFHNSVRGIEYDGFINECENPLNCPTNKYFWSALSFMSLYQYDPGGTLYQVIKKHFSNLLLDQSLGNFVNGEKVWGIAKIAKAQWDKECVDLTLYNRKLTYDQDLYAKNTLTIAPQQEDCYHSLNDSSLAEPIIRENKFTIEPGVTCNMKAGERIVLKPGFHAKAGSNFRAYIEPNLCTDGQIAPPGSGGNNEPNYESWVAQANTKIIKQQEEHSAQTITNTSLNEQNNNLPKQEFNIHPNPNTGVFSIYVQALNEQEQLQLSVMDVYGKQLLAQQINNSVNHQIDLSAYSKGIYYVSVTGTNGFREVKKVVVN